MSNNTPGESTGAARLGPWTFHTCVTAACTRCEIIPLDEDTGLTPHFDSAFQAADELVRDWGWHVITGADQREELLCPPCTAAASEQSPPPARQPDEGQEPAATPWWEDNGLTPRRGRPARNFHLPPGGVRPGEGD